LVTTSGSLRRLCKEVITFAQLLPGQSVQLSENEAELKDTYPVTANAEVQTYQSAVVIVAVVDR
jgi:hypothetical protein